LHRDVNNRKTLRALKIFGCNRPSDNLCPATRGGRGAWGKKPYKNLSAFLYDGDNFILDDNKFTMLRTLLPPSQIERLKKGMPLR
jgi:hypothetical protein